MKTLSLFFSLLFATSLSAEPIVDVTKVAGKTKEVVDSVLGAPDSSSSTKHGMKFHYAKGDTEIVFINDLADWITVEGVDHLAFSTAALKHLGLPEGPPSNKTDYSLRWDEIDGLLEVSIFKGSDKCDYAYIKTRTK